MPAMASWRHQRALPVLKALPVSEPEGTFRHFRFLFSLVGHCWSLEDVFPQDLPDQAISGQKREAEPADPAMDPHENWK
ncbi:Hypothetical predicted protein [Podarcis lilfordi]|uniref:Uncharacterized protein n=1 Tax=Podarcis lilfordi TaxID=74358 RepID=A0AA35LE98_9SAUR|nr:Hypothetical predicted protein [Podarcis lilfordi]